MTDQRQALDNQFKGMTDTPFTYEDFENTRIDLINKVNALFDSTDKEFLLSFEMGEPNWEKCCAGDLSEHPSVKWKLQNIQNLKSSNAEKFSNGVMKLRNYLEL